MTKDIPVLNKKEDLASWIVAIRRFLHSIPEPGFKEFKTSKFIQEVLKSLHIPFESGIAQTGIVAEIGSGEPIIALRADMDGLKIEEKTGLPFSSTHKGYMHACGHDGHMAMLLGAAALLKDEETTLRGTIRLIFQPAEEGLGGAAHMIEHGALDKVSMIFGGHIDRHYKPGEMVVQEGLICAYADTFKLEIHGKDGHAARPYEAIDSIVIAAHLVTATQSLVTRELNPIYPTVISIGKIEAGTAPNIIAGHAVLYGTVRTTHPDIRKKVLKRFSDLIHSISASFHASVHLDFYDCYPPVINNEYATSLAKVAAKNTQKVNRIVTDMPPSLGGEDFSYYLKKVPGCFVRFGAQKKGFENIPAHSSKFDFDEKVLEIGAEYYKNLSFISLSALKKDR